MEAVYEDGARSTMEFVARSHIFDRIDLYSQSESAGRTFENPPAELPLRGAYSGQLFES